MSNDQSPPVRKVIPYKKSGRRPSPFAEMAFQFSGTALDVAIQQREQEVVEEIAAETPSDEAPLDESLQATSPDPEAESLQELTPTATEPSPDASDVDRVPISPASAAAPKPESGEKRNPPRSVSLITRRKSKTPEPAAAAPDLQAFIIRWKPFLTDTQIGICAYVYNNSVAINREYCFTSTPKLMEAVSKTERQVQTVLNQLIDWEFLIKGETIVNAPRERRGTFYKLNLDKS
ncbi:MAG: hypothetical protein WCF57_15180 [Pyrinomonadaceae bacterium]